ncbi:MAG: hypothetical protein J1F61_05565 [Clostridiales bacterium]|nr:hypothetical protein [Clostridiales bacterium]
MSWKSLLFSILSVLLFWGLLAVTVFLFSIYWILGILGIVMVLVIPAILVRKAIISANGILDKLIAKYVVPALMLIGVGATLLIVFLN